jgi:predicted dehydrogenase
MSKLQIAIAGCGFWANYQVAAWKELEEVEIVAAYNRTMDKAYDFQKRFGIAGVFSDVETNA